MKLFLVSASTGMGHIAASRAVELAAKERGHQVISIDAMDHVAPAFRSWFRGGYEKLVRDRPGLWGHLYKSADRPLFNYWFQTALDQAFSGPIAELIERESPDWVVCTHSVSQPRIAKLNTPMAVVVTDLYPHRMWLRGSPDLFCVATEWSKKILLDRVPGVNVSVTGIPISPEFHSIPDIRPRQVLITTGGISGGPVAEVAHALSELDVAELHIVTGWNNELQTRLKQDRALQNVTVYGHLNHEQMAHVMQTSALIVSKPGGLTTSEALATGTPFVVYRPFMIPGQEERNASFLVESGAGVEARDLEALKKAVYELLLAPERLSKMREIALQHGKPNAAADVVAAIESQARVGATV